MAVVIGIHGHHAPDSPNLHSPHPGTVTDLETSPESAAITTQPRLPKILSFITHSSPMPSSNPELRAMGAWQSNIRIPKDTELKIGGKSTGTSSKTYTTSKSSSTFLKPTNPSPWSSVNRRS